MGNAAERRGYIQAGASLLSGAASATSIYAGYKSPTTTGTGSPAQ